MWIKDKIQSHFDYFGSTKVRVKRMYNINRIVIDFYGGRCATYDYDGNWIVG